MYEVCTKLTIETPELRQLRRSGFFIINFEHISFLFLVFLLLTLNWLIFSRMDRFDFSYGDSIQDRKK